MSALYGRLLEAHTSLDIRASARRNDTSRRRVKFDRSCKKPQIGLMKIFAIMAPAHSDTLKAAIASNFPERWYEVFPGQFFVAAAKSKTSAEVAATLGLSGGSLGRAIVLPVSNWHGWHSKDTWEWLNAQFADSGDTASG